MSAAWVATAAAWVAALAAACVGAAALVAAAEAEQQHLKCREPLSSAFFPDVPTGWPGHEYSLVNSQPGPFGTMPTHASSLLGFADDCVDWSASPAGAAVEGFAVGADRLAILLKSALPRRQLSLGRAPPLEGGKHFLSHFIK